MLMSFILFLKLMQSSQKDYCSVKNEMNLESDLKRGTLSFVRSIKDVLKYFEETLAEVCSQETKLLEYKEEIETFCGGKQAKVIDYIYGKNLQKKKENKKSFKDSYLDTIGSIDSIILKDCLTFVNEIYYLDPIIHNKEMHIYFDKVFEETKKFLLELKNDLYCLRTIYKTIKILFEQNSSGKFLCFRSNKSKTMVPDFIDNFIDLFYIYLEKIQKTKLSFRRSIKGLKLLLVAVDFNEFNDSIGTGYILDKLYEKIECFYREVEQIFNCKNFNEFFCLDANSKTINSKCINNDLNVVFREIDNNLAYLYLDALVKLSKIDFLIDYCSEIYIFNYKNFKPSKNSTNNYLQIERYKVIKNTIKNFNKYLPNRKIKTDLLDFFKSKLELELKFSQELISEALTIINTKNYEQTIQHYRKIKSRNKGTIKKNILKQNSCMILSLNLKCDLKDINYENMQEMIDNSFEAYLNSFINLMWVSREGFAQFLKNSSTGQKDMNRITIKNFLSDFKEEHFRKEINIILCENNFFVWFLQNVNPYMLKIFINNILIIDVIKEQRANN
ncbi:hypothetical protein H312_00077 [Anncaliia algerae PRA339]|uniref:Uncharacterized protein n=1 Tax=Anncaliia algerae PRA339 TaxID=1288291 RepID=A0A059F5Y4_9MICR|nr:hypothetical protein H312_00077 [Anncaliia algerae PRA339]